MTFGLLMRTARLSVEVSMLALASETGVAESTVSRWETGEWHPAEAKTVLRIARFLGADPLPMLIAWGRERGCYPLPPTGDDRDLAAVAAMLCWTSMPTSGPVVVTLQPGEEPLKIVRQAAGAVLPQLGDERDECAEVIASRWSSLSLAQARELTALLLAPPA